MSSRFSVIAPAVWFAVMFLLPLPVAAGKVTLAWDPNPEPNVSYIIAYGTQPGNLTSSINVGTAISGTVTNLIAGQRYYFAVHAYILSAMSPASAEVSSLAQADGSETTLTATPAPTPAPIPAPTPTPTPEPTPTPPPESEPAPALQPEPDPTFATEEALSTPTTEVLPGRRRGQQIDKPGGENGQGKGENKPRTTASTPRGSALDAPAACATKISSENVNLSSSAQLVMLAVSSPAECTWTAATGASWLTIVGGAQGSGTGSVELAVAGKRAGGMRTADVKIGVSTITITQSGGSAASSVSRWDVDADGRADMGVWRPASGHWYVRFSTAPSAAPYTRDWGSSEFGDTPVPGDYDGDGKGDLAVWRPSAGLWKVLQSSSNFSDYLDIAVGGADDVPVPADYDGDGKTDVAVWRPLSGMWSVKTSSTAFADGFSFLWGTDADVPVTGDYDGDGRADLGVWRPTTGLWSIRLSHVNYAPTHTLNVQVARGSGADAPVTGDFDGDGASDLAVWRMATGGWQLVLSETDFSPAASRTIGTSQPAAGDRPVPADYDGDGRTDVAMWRRALNRWQVALSSTGFNKLQSMEFGQSSKGDVPVTR